MVDRAEKRSLKELCLNDRASDLYKRLLGEYNRTFGYRPYVTRKLEVSQITDEVVVEVIVLFEESQIVFRELKAGKIIDNLFQSCHNGISAVLGDISEEHVEINYLIPVPAVQITVGHGELIEIREHTHVGSVIPHTVIHTLPPPKGLDA